MDEQFARVENGADTDGDAGGVKTGSAKRGTVARGAEAVLVRCTTMIDELSEGDATRVVRYLAEKYEHLIDGE